MTIHNGSINLISKFKHHGLFKYLEQSDQQISMDLQSGKNIYFITNEYIEALKYGLNTDNIRKYTINKSDVITDYRDYKTIVNRYSTRLMGLIDYGPSDICYWSRISDNEIIERLMLDKTICNINEGYINHLLNECSH